MMLQITLNLRIDDQSVKAIFVADLFATDIATYTVLSIHDDSSIIFLSLVLQ
jgi:hypothetical protein